MMESLWQNFGGKEKMQYLRRTSHLSDCTFIVVEKSGGRTTTRLELHKWILACGSPVFERMLYDDYKGSNPFPEITITNCNLVDFKRLIDYIYYEDDEKLNQLHIDALKNVYFVADHYKVMALKNSCLRIVKSKIAGLDTRDLVTAFEFAQRIREKDILRRIVHTIKNSEQQAAEIACPRIYDMDVDVFYEFLVCMVGVVDELSRFGMVETYVNVNDLLEMEPSNESTSAVEADEMVAVNQPTAKGTAGTIRLFRGTNISGAEIVKLFLKSIHFTRLSPQEFCNGPGKSVLLNLEQKYQILDSIVAISEEQLK